MPSRLASTVSSGSARVAAITRGSTSFCTGFAPSERIASTCSVTCIAPSSAVMPAPTRPADHQRGEHRPQLAREREADHASHVGLGAEARQRESGLERQHHAGEERRDQHDRGRARADRLELAQRLERREAAAAERAPGRRGQLREAAELVDAVEHQLAEPGQPALRQPRPGAHGARPAVSTSVSAKPSTHASKARWAGSGSPAATTRKS